MCAFSMCTCAAFMYGSSCAPGMKQTLQILPLSADVLHTCAHICFNTMPCTLWACLCTWGFPVASVRPWRALYLLSGSFILHDLRSLAIKNAQSLCNLTTCIEFLLLGASQLHTHVQCTPVHMHTSFHHCHGSHDSSSWSSLGITFEKMTGL